MMSKVLTKKSSKLYSILLLFLSLSPNLVRGMENEDGKDEKSITKFLRRNKVIVALGSLAVYAGYKYIQTARLYIAITNRKQPKEIEALLRWGASVSYDMFSASSFDFALTYYNNNKNLMPVMQILIDHGADPCKQDENGDTIFHRAARDADSSETYENLCSLTKQCSGKKMTLIDFARSKKNILKVKNNKGEAVEDIFSRAII